MRPVHEHTGYSPRSLATAGAAFIVILWTNKLLFSLAPAHLLGIELLKSLDKLVCSLALAVSCANAWMALETRQKTTTCQLDKSRRYYLTATFSPAHVLVVMRDNCGMVDLVVLGVFSLIVGKLLTDIEFLELRLKTLEMKEASIPKASECSPSVSADCAPTQQSSPASPVSPVSAPAPAPASILRPRQSMLRAAREPAKLKRSPEPVKPLAPRLSRSESWRAPELPRRSPFRPISNSEANILAKHHAHFAQPQFVESEVGYMF